MIPLNSTMEKSLAFTMEFSLTLRQYYAKRYLAEKYLCAV